ncbi:hypothetical protein F5Y18DRAFT_367822 [Xylariaceae sp. FL1019]|nr:hypothetical protein F5Y18DRAFT_367822 [Xylariaceae sp. FL1019]
MTAAARRASTASSSAENARQRELNKFYQPWLDFKALNAVPADTGPDASSSKRSSPDAALTAFTQLAALRLNVKRAMVSLIDTQTQIILAEATQTVSLLDESRHAPGDHIWLGNVALPRADCMDEHTLNNTTTFHNAEGQEVEVESFIVPDTLCDDRFKDRPYVTSGFAVRFYAGVPIVTKQGHAIGVYAVSDTKPRHGLTYDEVLFMADVAQIIAEHLDRVMGSMGRVSERDFMRGISYFLEDLSEYKYNINNLDRSKAPGPPRSTDTRATDAQTTTPSRGRQSHPGSAAISAANSPSLERGDHSAPDTSQVPQYSCDNATGHEEVQDSSKSNVRRIFVQASQLICEQAKATGCLFTDVASGLFSSQSIEGRSPSRSVDPWAMVDVALDSTEDDEPGANEKMQTPVSPTGPFGGLPEAKFGDRADDMADVISLALAEGCSDDLSSGIIKRKSLTKCIMRYPFGKCFYLYKGRVVLEDSLVVDEAITGGGSTQKSSDAARLKDQSPIALPKEVLKCMPDAKWLIFLPLFNYSQGQWCAAGFIWGNDFKMGDPDDALPYFKTFGSCMMSEVASMEVLNTNIAKSTFIASISHDLRSPLHGLLGNLEFLEDTLSTAYQMNLIGAIETCGKTLLDTIDHLLDYAKINNLRWSSGSRGAKRSRTIGTTSPQDSRTTSFDLSVLLEEVVEAVFAGQTFRKSNIRQYDPVDEAIDQINSISLDEVTPLDEKIHEGSAKFSGKVFLLLDIQKRSWFLQGQTGALRRVIMNVVGNAIKYCKEGFIEISLTAENITDTGVNVELTVKDTGIGMSRDFLANHLFKAFSQEDSFTPGTGLGLSIASQIVSNLHGKIRVASEKGVGTHVSVTIPLETASPHSIGDMDQDVRDAVDYANGKQVCILEPGISNQVFGEAQFSKLESSISTLFHTWFGMEVFYNKVVDSASDAKIYIYAEPPPIDYLLDHHATRKENGDTNRDAALLIICTNAFEAAALRAAGVKELTSLGRIVEVISQPVGVRKLARVLLQCLKRLDAPKAKNEEIEEADAPVSSFPTREVQEQAAEIEWNASSVVYDKSATRYRPSVNTLKWKSDVPNLNRRRDSLPGVPSSHPDIPVGRIPDPMATHPVEMLHTTQRPRVLLVDDNAINLKLLMTFMKKIQLPYAEAINGLQAFNKFKEADERFNVVLMDLQMPVMNGLESTRRIREYEQQTMATPARIIAITGVGNDVARQEAIDAGMSDFLTKPVRLKLLQELLLESP